MPSLDKFGPVIHVHVVQEYSKLHVRSTAMGSFPLRGYKL